MDHPAASAHYERAYAQSNSRGLAAPRGVWAQAGDLVPRRSARTDGRTAERQSRRCRSEDRSVAALTADSVRRADSARDGPQDARCAGRAAHAGRSSAVPKVARRRTCRASAVDRIRRARAGHRGARARAGRFELGVGLERVPLAAAPVAVGPRGSGVARGRGGARTPAPWMDSVAGRARARRGARVPGSGEHPLARRHRESRRGDHLVRRESNATQPRGVGAAVARATDRRRARAPAAGRVRALGRLGAARDTMGDVPQRSQVRDRIWRITAGPACRRCAVRVRWLPPRAARSSIRRLYRIGGAPARRARVVVRRTRPFTRRRDAVAIAIWLAVFIVHHGSRQFHRLARVGPALAGDTRPARRDLRVGTITFVMAAAASGF